MRLTIENTYDNITFLEDKLKNNNLTPSEYKEISDDINNSRIKALNQQVELDDFKKIIRANEARSFMDRNK